MVGDRKDSETYVRQKKLAAEKCGFNFFLKKESENVKKEELLKIIDEFNENKEVHGLIIQLPLPKHIDEKEILDKVSYEKDVDGFHLLNIGSFYILQ
jgi:5,10-methylene-tetrahydrofolate dehydrogenase/methenyl tetrahydrofolate cyclohydrolase